MSDSYKIYASKDYVNEQVNQFSEDKLDKGSPAAYQQIVTDASGAPTWENRTHYDDIQTITWDGSTDGLVQAGSNIYKVSDLTPSSQYISEGKFEFTASKSSITYRNLIHFGYAPGDSYAISFVGTTVYVIDEAPVTIEGRTYPEAGTYFNNNRGSYLTSLSWGELKQLDEKYLPSTVPVIQTATVGQTIAIKAVDENGKPTEWEASNLPEGFSGDYNDLTNKPTIPSIEGLASETTIDNKISIHDTSTIAHNDIRELITGLTTRLNALADSDDTTLDQLSEIVSYIKSNKSLIENITTNKVNVSDIIDNLTTYNTTKPLSANQGATLKDLIDILEIKVNAIDYPVDSVNGKTGEVVLTAEDVGALPDTTVIPSIDGLATEAYVDNKISTINYPVDSVNGKTGAIVLTAEDISAGTFAGQVVAEASAQTPETSLLRNSSLVSTETTPTNNGEICWQYE